MTTEHTATETVSSDTIKHSTEFLVIGAGSAGSVLTRRLLDAGHRVTLVEAGDQDINPDIDDVSRLGFLWGSEQDWNYYTEPQPGWLGVVYIFHAAKSWAAPML